MPSLVIVGAQWGDEGKGKIVDYLTSDAHWVVRFQGGNNAGHTLVVDGHKTRLSLVPSGILHPGVQCLLAAGVVIDLSVLLAELSALSAAGIEQIHSRVFVDQDATLVLPFHRLIDQEREHALGTGKIGTTGRGIGPAYEDRAARCCIRVGDLQDLPQLKPRFQRLVEEKNRYLDRMLRSEQRVSFDEAWDELCFQSETVVPLLCDGPALLNAGLAAGQRAVFEGAQGTLLDQIHGTAPFVTSSQTVAGAVCAGAGIGPRAVQHVLGVAKAYQTRVGEGPFPTELCDATGEWIRRQGGEFGTVTGRPRRCGWLDLVLLRRAVLLNGCDSIGVTKLDVLTGLESLKVCVAYRLGGREYSDVPLPLSRLDAVQPVFQELRGWKEDLTELGSRAQLPETARDLLTLIESRCERPISLLSLGAERRSTLLDPSFFWSR